MYTKEQIEKAVKGKGYTWFENGDYNLNIVCVRTIHKDKDGKINNKVTNLFDDYITLNFKIDGKWQSFSWMATTDPGNKAFLKPSNKNGVARLIPGQYRSTHEVRKHQGKYDALCQKFGAKLKVWRDNNKDLIMNENKIFDDVSGLNIHKAGTASTYVENWSEACMVFKYAKDFEVFMKYVKIALKKYSNSFTITLIESTDIK